MTAQIMLIGIVIFEDSRTKPFCSFDIRCILSIPKALVTWPKILGIVDFHRDQYLTTWTNVETQFGISLVVLGNDEQQSPLTAAEHSFKRLFIDDTRLGRRARMRVQPYSCELFRLSAKINLGFKKVRHCFITEFHTNSGDFLFNRNEFFYKEQVILFCYTKPTYFIVRFIPEVKQLRPCRWAES